MRTLLVVYRDEDSSRDFVFKQLLDYDKMPEVLSYVPVSIPSAAAKADPSALDLARRQKWDLPLRTAALLAVLDAEGSVLERLELTGDDVEEDLQSARDFMIRNRLPERDATEMLATALDQARRSNRNVLVVGGGPRCGPCFRLGRWLEDQKPLLKRDYVIIKVGSGRERNRQIIYDKLASEIRGIPWMVILNAQGEILVDSNGPLGNIGLPTDFESLRHFREMLADTAKRLSRQDIDDLLRSVESR